QTLSPVHRFDDDWPADLVSGFVRFFQCVNYLTVRHRNAVALKTFLGFVFVLRQLDSNYTRSIGHRCLNVVKMLSIAELNAITGPIPPPRNAAFFSGLRDCASRWKIGRA